VERVRQQHGIAPCVTPGALFFHTRERRILTPKEHALLQGFHEEDVNRYKFGDDPKSLRKAVGNAFSLPLAIFSMMAAMRACRYVPPC